MKYSKYLYMFDEKFNKFIIFKHDGTQNVLTYDRYLCGLQ